jgi:drug/metabolite transporter (DMT)-like permease
MALLLAAVFFFSLMSVQVKLAGRTLPVEMLVLARGVVTLVLSYGWIRARNINPFGNDTKLLLLRGLLGLGGLSCFFYAVTALPLAEVTVIHYLNPIVATLLAAVWLGERVDRRLVIAIALSLVGTLCVTRPATLWGSVNELSRTGVVAAFGGALFSGCAYATVRRLSKTDSPHVIVFYLPLLAVPATLPFAIHAWVWPDLVGWLLLLGIGVSTQLAQVLFTKGLIHIPAGRGTTVGYVQIVYAAGWGYLLFGEAPKLWTVVGAALIVGGTSTLLRRATKIGDGEVSRTL